MHNFFRPSIAWRGLSYCTCDSNIRIIRVIRRMFKIIIEVKDNKDNDGLFLIEDFRIDPIEKVNESLTKCIGKTIDCLNDSV